MKPIILAITSALAANFAVVAPAYAAISINDVLVVEYLFPDQTTVYQESGTFLYTGAGQTISTQSGYSSIILSDYSVIFSESPGCGDGCVQSPADFNGPVLFDLTNTSAFTGWVLLSDTVGITSSILDGGEIGVNWQGAVVQGQSVIGAVPEPSVWAMMVVGFASVGFALRHRRSTKITYA